MSLSENPYCTATMRILTASLSAAGEFEKAKGIAARLQDQEPDFSISHYEQTRLPFRNTETRERFVDGLKAAGLPA